MRKEGQCKAPMTEKNDLSKLKGDSKGEGGGGLGEG